MSFFPPRLGIFRKPYEKGRHVGDAKGEWEGSIGYAYDEDLVFPCMESAKNKQRIFCVLKRRIPYERKSISYSQVTSRGPFYWVPP